MTNTARKAAPNIARKRSAPSSAAKSAEGQDTGVSRAQASRVVKEREQVVVPEDNAVQGGQKSRKPAKVKLVRDGFTMPEDEHDALRKLKKTCNAAGLDVKKSELIRIGIMLVCALDTDAVATKVAGLKQVRRGRPAAE